MCQKAQREVEGGEDVAALRHPLKESGEKPRSRRSHTRVRSGQKREFRTESEVRDWGGLLSHQTAGSVSSHKTEK
jgi:hypothetical protein